MFRFPPVRTPSTYAPSIDEPSKGPGRALSETGAAPQRDSSLPRHSHHTASSAARFHASRRSTASNLSNGSGGSNVSRRTAPSPNHEHDEPTRGTRVPGREQTPAPAQHHAMPSPANARPQNGYQIPPRGNQPSHRQQSRTLGNRLDSVLNDATKGLKKIKKDLLPANSLKFNRADVKRNWDTVDRFCYGTIAGVTTVSALLTFPLSGPAILLGAATGAAYGVTSWALRKIVLGSIT